MQAVSRPYRQNYNLDTITGRTEVQRIPYAPGFLIVRFDRNDEAKSARQVGRAGVASWLRAVRNKDGFEILPR